MSGKRGWSNESPISIHPLTDAELEAADEVIMAAYSIQHSRKDTLRRYLALQSGDAFLAKHDGAVIGFGGVINYGSFAYVGLMSVHPTMQKQGIGRVLVERLLTWLDAHGCASVLLDATPGGAPLYTSYGFIEDDRTQVLRQTQQVLLPSQLPVDVSPLSEEDLPALVAFDAPYFGSERREVLTSYWADDPQRTFVARNADGQITGYLIAQSQTLGPWVAHTTEDAEQLLVHALVLPFEREPNVFVSVHNSDALELLKRYGFSQQRVLSHMRRGEPVQRSRHTTLYGQANLGFG